MSKLSVIVRYLDGSTMNIEGLSFKQAVSKIHSDAEVNRRSPLLLTFSTGKKMYYDEEQIRNYVENNIDQLELIEATECDGIYRNATLLKMDGGEEMEEGWLWTKKGNYVFLVDKDRSVYCDYDERLFVES